jgi:endonuclease III
MNAPPRALVPPFADQLDALEKAHGPQRPGWPVDPYQFLIWWHCGYPASDAACARGWDSLKEQVGLTPDQLLEPKAAVLARALRPGGLVPELRAKRIREIATAVRQEPGGNLARALAALSPQRARAMLKRFPGISDPGADRILLFAGLASVAAVPSNAPQVPVRMQLGRTDASYARNYADSQRVIQTEVPPTLVARRRAYLLLKVHGQTFCKRSRPLCATCPIATACAQVLRG